MESRLTQRELFDCIKLPQRGNLDARVQLGHRYCSGNGARSSPKKMVSLDEPLAKGDAKELLPNLVLCYREGQGTDANQKKSMYLWQTDHRLTRSWNYHTCLILAENTRDWRNGGNWHRQKMTLRRAIIELPRAENFWRIVDGMPDVGWNVALNHFVVKRAFVDHFVIGNQKTWNAPTRVLPWIQKGNFRASLAETKVSIGLITIKYQ